MAADTSSKRLREETQENDDLVNKKPKSYITDILSLLEEEDDDSTEDLSSLMKTLEHELSTVPELHTDGSFLSSSSSLLGEEESESVMRHLLEASDDELGLPVIEASTNEGVQISSGEDVSGSGSEEEVFDICDGLLWQLEYEAANDYDLMQSGLFMPQP